MVSVDLRQLGAHVHLEREKMNELYLWAMWFAGLVMGIGVSAGFWAIKQWLEETIREAVKNAKT